MATNYILYEITNQEKDGKLELKCLGKVFDELPLEGSKVTLTKKSEIEHWKIEVKQYKIYKVEKVTHRYTLTQRVRKESVLAVDCSLVYLKEIKEENLTD